MREAIRHVIDRDRVGQLVCQPGDRVGIELGFLWDSEPRMVAAHFRRFVGSRYSARRDLGEQISLEGDRVRQVVDGDQSYASVELSGVVPGSIEPATRLSPRPTTAPFFEPPRAPTPVLFRVGSTLRAPA